MIYEGITAPDFAPLDTNACKHQLLILEALLCARPLLFEGKECFVQALNARQSGGRIEMDVWLAGNPNVVVPDALTLPDLKK